MKHKLLSILLCLAMALSLLPTAALAEEATGAGPIKVGETSYSSFSDAVNAAEPDESGVITYKISGKVDVTDTGWVQVAKAGLTDLSKVEFIGITDDAEICITEGKAILADESYDIDVSFENLKLSHPNGAWFDDLGHATNYFTCWLRNKNAEENTVTYTNCTFPNGVCNNQYGKTVFDSCQFTNSANYNLWNYGGNTEVKNSTFTGVRGIKTYNEGTLAVAPTVTIEQTTFSGLTEKAAIVVSKATDITLTDVTATSCTMGLLQKDIEGSTGEQKVTIEANGTGISGNFNITSNTDAAAAKSEFNITAGTFSENLDPDYLAPGATINESGPVEMNPVAKVGTTKYNTLEAAFAALNETDHTLTLIDSDAWTYDNVYWKAGTESGSATTLKDAMEAAYAKNAESITIICKPNATITTSPAHINVTGDITVYANGADFGGNDLSIGTYAAPENNTTTINIYDAKNLVVWGQPAGGRADVWKINFTDCVNDGWNFLMYRGGETDTAKINATLTGCKATGFEDSIIHTTADGSITIKNCEFANNCAPVNIAHKQAGAMTVTVENSTFTSCGETDTTKDLYRYAAPVRIVNNNAAGTVATEVTNCTFTGTVGNNGDILIGDGRDGKDSNDVTLTVSGTAASVQAQKPGYYNGASTVDSKKAERELTAADSLHTTIADLLPVTEVDLDEFIKLVTSAGYSFDGTSVAGTGKKLTVKWSPVSGCFELAKGSSHHSPNVSCPNVAATGNTPNRVNSDLAQYQLFKAATDVTIKNVNFEYIPADFTICANSNWAGSWTGDVVKSAQLQLETKAAGDIVIDGCSFDQVVFTSFNNNGGSTTIKNSEFKNIYNSYAIKDIRGTKVSVTDTTITNCGGGIMVSSTKSVDEVTISDNIFTNVDVTGTAPEDKVGTRGLIQIASSGDYTEADITLDGNTATNCGLILRQLNQGIADGDVLKNNLKGDLTGLGGKLTYTSDSVKKTDGNEPVQPTVYTVKFENADVAEMKVIQGTEITLPAPSHRPNYTFEGWYVGNNKVNSPYTVSGDVTLVAQWRYIDQGGGSSSGSGSSSGDYTVSVDADKHGTVTVSPKRADKGDTVTITVKPNKGYELDELTVTDANGNEISVRSRGNNQYTFTMPAGKVEVKATFMEDNSMLNFFYDVPNNAYYYEAVKWAQEKSITGGIGNGLFGPNQPCTRAQIVTFLWRAAGSPEPKAMSSFADVSTDAYYAKAVAWAVENGITTGTGDGKFSPDATCTRAQSVTFLFRAIGKLVDSKAEFSDVLTDSYYANAVAWAVENGVTNGIGDGLFGPDNSCTRAQIVTFLFRAYQGK